MKKMGVVNYEVGNLKSIKNALDYCGLSYVISSDLKELASCDRLVVPGVGAFGTGMANLKRLGLVTLLREVADQQMPILGICLGYQMLCKSSVEFGHFEGLNLLPTTVRKIAAPILPHVGWNKLNSISFELSNSLYKGIENQKYYFVHTFAVDLNKDVDSFSSTTKYAEDTFASSMKFKNIFGVQFHPEKSSEQGLMVLKNFYNY